MHVDRKGPLPFLVGNIFELFKGALMRRVVDQHVDPPERLGGLRNDAATMRRVGQVAGDEQGLPPLRLDQCLRLGGIVMFVEIGDEHVRALARKGQRDRAADAAVAAGDDRLFAREPARSLVARLAMIGARVHRSGATGDRLLLFGIGRGRVIGHERLLVQARQPIVQATRSPAIDLD
jgi:hypothetical protein